MDLYSLYRRGESLYTGIPKHVPFLRGWALPPLQVVFELTYRCNLACEFCFQRHQEEQLGVIPSRDELTADEIQSIVAQTLPWTVITLVGGEALMRKDALAIISATASKRPCHLVTNGTLITPKIADHLVSIGLTSVGISIEGRQEVHDRVRGSGTFAKATAAARLLIEYRRKRGKKRPLVNLKTTITEGNVDHLAEIVDLTRDLDADYCTLQIMNTSVMTSGMYFHHELDQYCQPTPPIIGFPLEILRAQLSLVRERAERSRVRVRFSPNLAPSQFLRHYSSQVNMGDFSCLTPWTVANVSASGEVFPCLNYSIGNLRQHRLLTLWNSERYRTFRRLLLRDGLFAGCQGCCDLIARQKGD